MGLPISVRSRHTWITDLLQVPFVGGLLVFAIALFPGVAVVSAANLALRRFTEDQAFAIGLLLAVPWNGLLKLGGIHVRVLFVPAWVFAGVLGLFGVAKGWFGV